MPGVAWALSLGKASTACRTSSRAWRLSWSKGLAAVLAIRMREAILVGQFA
jgi:hypothetical protein